MEKTMFNLGKFWQGLRKLSLPPLKKGGRGVLAFAKTDDKSNSPLFPLFQRGRRGSVLDLAKVGFFIFFPIVVVSTLMAGCGQVSTNPLSPLYQPTVYNVFGSWVYDYSTPGAQPSPSVSSSPSLSGSGSLKLPITFTAVGDKYATDVPVTSLPTNNLTNKAFSIWGYWDHGLTDSSGTVQAKIYVRNPGDGFFMNGASVNLQMNRWVQIVFNVNSPAYLSGPETLTGSANIVGVEVDANSGAKFSSGVVYLDDFGF